MAEYIEREAVKAAFKENFAYGQNEIFANLLERVACEIVDKVVVADVQPVIHAKWILFDRDSVGRAFYCSNCRKVTTTDDYEDTPLDREEYFCMRCGADMRGEDNG